MKLAPLLCLLTVLLMVGSPLLAARSQSGARHMNISIDIDIGRMAIEANLLGRSFALTFNTPSVILDVR